MDNSNTTYLVSFETLLAAIFIYLKLAGIGVVATWSWLDSYCNSINNI